MIENPEVSIHIFGAIHDSDSVKFMPEHKSTARDFLIPRGIPGINVVILEDYNLNAGWRNDFITAQQSHPLDESLVRGAFWRSKSAWDPQAMEEEVAKKMQDQRRSPRFQNDYSTRRLIMFDELRVDVDLIVDYENYETEEADVHTQVAKEIISISNQSLYAAMYGERVMAVNKVRQSMVGEAFMTRRRHPKVINLAEVYIRQAQNAGVPLRLMTSFGSGHNHGLVRAFENAFGDLEHKPAITSSYADSDSHLSHHYDLIDRMEYDTEYVPSDREALNILFQTAFVDSAACVYHPLRVTIPKAQMNDIVYSLLRDCSDNDVESLLKIVKRGGFESALTQLTGVGDLKFPNFFRRIVTWPVRELNKFQVLGKF